MTPGPEEEVHGYGTGEAAGPCASSYVSPTVLCLLLSLPALRPLFDKIPRGERNDSKDQAQEDAGPPLSEIYDIGFNRVPVLAKSAF